jgi:putative two-component system response regulator
MRTLTEIPATSIVLLVDDDLVTAAILGHMLTTEPDIEFHHCARADEAVALAARVRPTVILQDIVMPGANGLDLISEYRAQIATSQTPLVVLSAEDEPRTKAEAFRRGANDYLTKPPERIELIARVKYHSRAFRLLLRAEAIHEGEKQQLIAARHADVLRARDTLIFGLAKLAESRDNETGEHLERIAAYCRVLAEQLRASHPEFTDEWIRNLQLASSLHDIGKVAIPDSVLLKPGRLEPDERKIIERHPRFGADALNSILDRDPEDPLLLLARNIAACHHERWDGKGYPAGLAAEAIPIEARIVSVADVYDALTSRRVYKPAISHEEAVAAIVSGRGSQFDPRVVEALLQAQVVFHHAGLLLHEEHAGRAAHASAQTGERPTPAGTLGRCAWDTPPESSRNDRFSP